MVQEVDEQDGEEAEMPEDLEKFTADEQQTMIKR